MVNLKRFGCASMILLLVLFLALSLVPHSYAETLVSGESQQSSRMPPPKDVQGQSGNQERKTIPQEAIDACSGKSEGSACQCGGSQGGGSGTCGWTPDKKYFACKPSGMPQGGQFGGQNSVSPDGQNHPKRR
ncbi:MAG: hypothetical protein PHH68_05115 [Candidatus Omnitrophica bacterium]|nr:hypothetical protein [Candidatus Omnitrophota bacterium]MDD5079692.1 hypothetical protein [Candidatus Omnitrophota bacterium]